MIKVILYGQEVRKDVVKEKVTDGKMALGKVLMAEVNAGKELIIPMTIPDGRGEDSGTEAEIVLAEIDKIFPISSLKVFSS